LAANNAGGRDNTTVLALKSEDDSFPYNVPDYYTDRPITISDENPVQNSFEDKLLSKYANLFTIPVPKSAKEVSFLSNPFFVALVIVCICLGAYFTVSHFTRHKGKDFQELVGNVSGIKLDIRTPNETYTKDIIEARKKALEGKSENIQSEGRMKYVELWKEVLKDLQGCTVPLSNVQISISEKEGLNKFVGVSSTIPLEIRLPKGEYAMNLTYMDYKILNESNYFLINLKNLSFEFSGDLLPETVIMFPPEKAGEEK